jgi:NADPH:quinone reductase
MLAVVNTPKGAAPVELLEVPEPVPAANEALVAVHAFSLNRGELTLFRVRPEGWRPGQDVSGVVLQAAADGSGPQAGTRVVALKDMHGWAERIPVPTHRIAGLPDNVGFAEAASLPVAGLTALRAVRYGEPLLGRRVLITGASGGVGNLAVQIAIKAGAKVTAVCRPERGAAFRAIGAETVSAIAEAKGLFALVLESVGGASLKEAINHLDAYGVIVMFGNSSGEPTSISFPDFTTHRNSRIEAFHYFTSAPEERFGPDLALLANLIGDGALKPHIGSETSWRDLPQVAAQLRERRLEGKAIFRIDVK